MTDPKTSINELVDEKFRYNGTEWKIERYTRSDFSELDLDGDDLEDSDVVYKLICLGEDVPSGYKEQIKSKILIGCPNCHENNYANFTVDGKYSCRVCDYENKLNIATFMAPR